MGCACFYVVGAVVISVDRCGTCVCVYENVKKTNVKTLIERGRQAKEPEKYDEKPTYKMFLGYSSGVVVIGDVIVGIENRDANTNVRFKQKETLERIFKQLKASGVQCFSTPYG